MECSLYGSENALNDKKLRDQFSAIVVNEINNVRIADEIFKLGIQDDNFRRAMEEIGNVRIFIGSPKNILGSDATKHGEIAENVEVGIRRAQQAFDGKKMTATFEGVGRTAPEDYIIDGIAVQSKFINGTNNNLTAIVEHMEKYSYFGRDGSYYHIPKDAYEIIEKIRNNENVEGFKSSTVRAIKEKIARIEEQSGKKFEDIVKPGISKYSEVQKGTVAKTLNEHEKDISQQNEMKKNRIKEGHKASLGEAVKATAIAGVVGATVSLVTKLYLKGKEGKCFYKGNFSKEDWKEVGIEAMEGGLVGAVSGSAIYALTNYALLSAPLAGAIVSASKGVSSLVGDLQQGKINQDEFAELGMIICSESAIVALATAAGQVAIPIPVLGAVVGSIAGSMLANFLGTNNTKTSHQISLEMKNYIEKLDTAYKKLVNEIVQEFDNLGELTVAAFDLSNNKKLLISSIELANAYGVDKSKIIKSISELDEFILG